MSRCVNCRSPWPVCFSWAPPQILHRSPSMLGSVLTVGEERAHFSWLAGTPHSQEGSGQEHGVVVSISFRVRNQNARPSFYFDSVQGPSWGWCHHHLNWAFSSQFNHFGKSPHMQCLRNTLHINPKNLAKLIAKITAELYQGHWFWC